MTQNAIDESYDAVVIGGGPAGSISGLQLARSGRRVLILERRTFPRFHIGESMLPYTAGILAKLDLIDQFGEDDYPVKWGAEFCGPTGEFRRVDFTSQGGGRRESAFQCERARFDDTLLKAAAEAGADVVQDARVTDVLTEGERVTGVRFSREGVSTTVRSRYVLDASGRAGVIPRQLFGHRRANTRLQLVATYKHFTGVDEATNPGVTGDIQVGNHDEGWLWAIPIRHDVLSVGAVTPASHLTGRDAEDVFTEHVSRIPRIRCRIEDAQATDAVRGESDYCYYSDTVAGPGWLAVGDSGSFIDPVFSAGVFLAICSGERGGQTVDAILSGADETEALDDYQSFYKTGYDCYTRLVYAFYDSNFNFGKYMKELADKSVNIDGRWISRLLSGDFWSVNNPVAAHLRSVEEYDTFAPFRITYGCPVYPEQDQAETLELAASR